MKKAILTELSKVAAESIDLDPEISKGIEDIARHIASTLTDEELDTINRHIDKKAKLINEGDTVICVDNFGPIFKGRRYLVSDANIPGYLCIKEQTGEDVGIFAVNRFVLDNNEQ